MRIRSKPPTPTGESGVSGTLRIDRRTTAVLRKAGPGDIAVIDHLDLDRGNAEALVDHGVVAVVNASPFISGRYPNLGPELLAKAGVLLIDEVGPEALAMLKDGAKASISEGTVYVDGKAAVTGHVLGLDEVQERMDAAREGLATQLQSFTHNTTEFLRREQGLLLHGQGIPDLDVKIVGRPVVVVVRDFDYLADLRRLRQFVREQKPVLIGVDTGADALLEARLKPDLIVIGEAGFARAGSSTVTAVSDKALRSAKQVVVHADASDHVIGADRLDRLGIRPQRIAASSTTEDVALLMAEGHDASVIVTVGTHATLDEFLDRQRSDLASTFLTRLRVGPRIVDAAAVPVLYAGRVRTWHLLLVLLVGLLAVAAAVASTPVGQDWADALLEQVRDFLDSIGLSS